MSSYKSSGGGKSPGGGKGPGIGGSPGAGGSAGGSSSGGQGSMSGGASHYPPHNEQVCDHCQSKDHEAKNCKKEDDRGFAGSNCKSCGHGDHDKKSCPLVPFKGSTMKLQDIPPEIYDQFTPTCRAAHVSKFVSKPANRTVPVGLVASPSKSPKSPPKTPPKSAGSPSGHKGGESPSSSPTTPTKGQKVPDDIQKKWDDAEKLMLRPKSITKNTEKNGDVLANFFKIGLKGEVKLYKYSITLGEMFDKPPLKPGEKAFERKLSKETKRYLVGEILKQYPPPHNKWACDYDSTFISSEPLYPNTAKTVGQVTDRHHTRTPKKQGDPRPIVKSKITYVGLVDIKGLLNHVDTKDDNYVSTDTLRALNIISWKLINDEAKFTGGLVGKKFYPASLRDMNEENRNLRDPTKPFMIRKGFFSSMRPGVSCVLLNVNTTTSAFYAPIKLSKWMDLFWSKRDEGWNHKIRHFKGVCKGLRVKFDVHEGGDQRKWIVHDISPQTVGNTTFRTTSNPNQPVRQYLQNTYNRPFDPDGFCINVGSDANKVWYPADQLTILDWQVFNKVLPGDLGKDMVTYAERKPGQHKDLIENTALSYLGLNPQTSFYSDFGITTENDFMKIGAKKVNPPRLQFAGKSLEIRNGAWNLGSVKFFKAVPCLTRLSIISFCDDRLTNSTPDLTAELREGLQTYGLSREGRKIAHDVQRVVDPQPDPNDPNWNYRTAIATRLGAAYQALTKPPIVLVVLPTFDITMYAEIKRWGDCQQGVPTVCITFGKLEGADKGLAANICLKFNAKLKGISHGLKDATPIKTGKTCMIVGADCTHPGDHAPGRPSIAGIVATNDDTSFHYLASARLQNSKQEYIEDLRSMMKERVKAWHQQATKKPGASKQVKDLLPNRILFYRDGVSESQYGMVLYQELPQIKDGCQDAAQELGAGRGMWKPDITLIVVTKRHHARFYDMRTTPISKDNLPPGTVIDSEVVTPNHVSFYLQAHASPKGTARSALYVVLEDTCKYSMKDLQNITNKISYTGARATKALSVCTPAQYADFLCDRLRCYMKPTYDGKYPLDPTPVARPALGNTPAVEGPRPDQVTDTDQLPSEYAMDSHIWRNKPEFTDDKQRTNPWHKNMDGIMFYV